MLTSGCCGAGALTLRSLSNSRKLEIRGVFAHTKHFGLDACKNRKSRNKIFSLMIHFSTRLGLQSQTPVEAKPYLLKLTLSLAITLVGLIPDTKCDSLKRCRWGSCSCSCCYYVKVKSTPSLAFEPWSLIITEIFCLCLSKTRFQFSYSKCI